MQWTQYKFPNWFLISRTPHTCLAQTMKPNQQCQTKDRGAGNLILYILPCRIVVLNSTHGYKKAFAFNAIECEAGSGCLCQLQLYQDDLFDRDCQINHNCSFPLASWRIFSARAWYNSTNQILGLFYSVLGFFNRVCSPLLSGSGLRTFNAQTWRNGTNSNSWKEYTGIYDINESRIPSLKRSWKIQYSDSILPIHTISHTNEF